ncbi:hypothetical protein I302_102909 [Kwoniella bestiolae CBS 10118]|uniref:Skg3/CAF120-like PH-like domain-containing protein n=1 Tax=Kwoniella bestiolae CBS 10118 TaxID=1296100 RepID=A0A1B9GGD4_9TREE|nr:hypothetical protein I302_01605 [Kwoniella bestiolae CBS 10118]OCF30086.1 hypothetical protein I302_01605 [Kwoniella bestiolae CBS 10118]
MFKRKSNSHTVSPLEPPQLSPASTDVSSFRFQQQQQQDTWGRGQPQSGIPNHQGGGISPSLPVERSVTRGSTGTAGTGKEKRRSGFFGLGGKKDKDKHSDKHQEREREKEDNRPRQSFSVDRNSTQQVHSQGPNGIAPRPQEGNNIPYNQNRMSQQLPPPGQVGTPPPPQQPYSPPPSIPQQQQQRAVSQPGPGQYRPNDDFSPPQLGSGGNATVPKSQSMGFARPQTQSYSPHGQQQQQSLPPSGPDPTQRMPRSSSMPIDQHTPPVPPAKINSPRNSLQNSPGGGGGNEPNSSFGGVLKRFDRIVELIAHQPQKTYVTSPPELEMILARTSAGGQPKQGQPGTAANDWDAVWLQLSGISLSMWSMKETRLAAAKGDKVPPTYFNVTDSSLELLAPLPPPPHRPNSHPHHYVFSLNTAGSNRLLFSCPSEKDLAKWAIGLRLAAWERSRLEEIYTGHLIQSGGREPKSDLVKGRMEGWVRVRVMGGTDWKRLYVVLSLPGSDEASKDDEKKGRRRSFFGMGDKEKDQTVQEPNTGVAMATFYNEPRTPKNKTSVTPVLTITNVTQCYSVFPERLEVMSQSNLCKVVGRVSGEMVTIEGRLRDSGWALLMPEGPGEGPVGEKSHHHGPNASTSPLGNMMKWVTGFHDVFGLYGRPEKYNWDPRNPKSLFFAYPQGEDRTNLFLTIDEAMMSDFRLPQLPAVRATFANLVQRKIDGQLRIANEPTKQAEEDAEEEENSTPRPEGDYRLPPLTFGDNAGGSNQGPDPIIPRSLTPITERTDIATRENSMRTTKSQFTATGIGAPSTGVAASGDRKASGGSSKQGSQGSTRQTASSIGGDLAPIADASTEGFGQLTEEPEKSEVITSPLDNQQSPANRTATEETAQTIWSQDTGTTPTPQSANQSSAHSFNHSQPLNIDPAPSSHHSQASDETTKHIPSSLKPASPPPALAQPISEPHVLSPTPRRVSTDGKVDVNGGIHEEPAALYLMNMVEDQPQQHTAPLNVPKQAGLGKSPSPERTRPTINTDLDPVTKQPRPEVGRKPSGARAVPPRKNSGSRILDPVDDHSPAADEVAPAQLGGHGRFPTSSTQADLGEDVSAFMNYAEAPASPVKPKAAPAQSTFTKPKEEFRSSFAPSKAAAERRAKAEQAEVDQLNARNLPGGGRRRAAAKSESSESESDEEEEEDGSPVEKKHPHGLPIPPVSPQAQRTRQSDPHVQRSTSRALPPVPRAPEVREPNGENLPHDRESYYPSQGQQSFDVSRPRSRSPLGAPSSMYSSLPAPIPAGIRNVSQSQPQPPPPATRQTMWNANFSADHGMPQENKSGRFVELEEPSVQLTKAFAPHGLLQAGMQDKEDRSAKKQEEVARETGSSLINVPSKPPPPQMGLLGAVAAHEKERKNAGGIGATLTDREREKRLAEDRQREIEKLQRQQMDHMRQFGAGDMYGQQQFPYGMQSPMGMNMGMNMGMMGMPPMGYSSYQGGFNPYAQQQAMMAAQMAYQQAMMMSAAGSQAGDHHDFPQPGSGSATPGGTGMGQPNNRASSPAGSTRSNNFSTPPPQMPQFNYGQQSFYGSPMMGMGGMGMSSPMMQPWMMQQPQMWGSPSPGPGQGAPSPMNLNQNQNRFDWLSPNQGGQGSQSGASDGAGDRRSRLSSNHTGEERYQNAS